MTATPYDCRPEDLPQKLEALPGGTPLIVDFDETLLLRNSTELYLDRLRPRWLAAALLYAIDVLKPWRVLPGGARRADWLRVFVASLLLPWSVWLWRRAAPALGEAHRNQALIDALPPARGPLIVATLGFGFIVRPLLAGMALPPHQLVACGFWRGGAERAAGKTVLVEQALGAQMLADAAVITDWFEDRELLDRAAHPLRVVWPGALYARAMLGAYVPLFYLEKIKRPGKKYFLHGVLLEDWMFWLLATLPLAAVHPFALVPGLLLLLLSFWCIYEQGYVENDRVAERFETDPYLSETYASTPYQAPTYAHWAWAALSGGLAVLLLRPDAVGLAALIWAAVLLLTRLSFRLFNHANKATRAWIFPVLQAWRSFAPAALLAMNLAGVLALVAHVWMRALPYFIYRFIGGEFPQPPLALPRLLSLLLLYAAVLLAGLPLLWWQALALLAWCTYRARREIRAAWRAAGPIGSR